MTDARLEALKAWRSVRGPLEQWQIGELFDEIDRLRAEARPEPIGYVASWRTSEGWVRANSQVWKTESAARAAMAQFDSGNYMLAALVPIEATP
jgi:hypothetical protein